MAQIVRAGEGQLGREDGARYELCHCGGRSTCVIEDAWQLVY
jgi:hypothetical protein